jgi:hypothetical protein
MAKKSNRKSKKSGVKVRDMKSRKDPRGGARLKTSAASAYKLK